ncbi:MAG: PEGA domain-containing protein, partial [Deltaproteobacteria bacterium]
LYDAAPPTALHDAAPPTALHDAAPPTALYRTPAAGRSAPPSRRRRPARIAAVAAVAVAAGAVALGVADRSRRSPPRRVTPAAVAMPADAAATATAPAAAQSLDAAAPPADAAPPPADAATAATLAVLTTPPGAVVSLDGERLPGVTPVRAAPVAPGRHRIAIDLAGHLPVARDVDLAAGEHRTVDVQLAQKPAPPPPRARTRNRPPRAGRLTARTTPWADVYLGGRKLGTTPFANLRLPAGTHTLVFKNPERKPVKRRVVIRPGATTKLNFALP